MAESTTTAPAARASGDLGAPDGFAAGDQPAVLWDFGAFVETAADGDHRLNLLIEGVHCGGCVHKIESALVLPENLIRVDRVNLLVVLCWYAARPR